MPVTVRQLLYGKWESLLLVTAQVYGCEDQDDLQFRCNIKEMIYPLLFVSVNNKLLENYKIQMTAAG